MTTPVVSDCIFPRCDDGTGKPVLTKQVMCSSCRLKYWRLLRWVLLDYMTLKTTLQNPVRTAGARSGKQSAKKSYGHPAQWASDSARDIAGALYWAESSLRDSTGHTRPYPRSRAGRQRWMTIEPNSGPRPRPEHWIAPTGSPQVGYPAESGMVAKAYRYLADHFDAFCELPSAGEHAKVLQEMHGKIRSSFGHRRVVRRLPVPCPSCDLIGTLLMPTGEGTDEVTCEACSYRVSSDSLDEFIDTLADSAIDTLIEQHAKLRAQEYAWGWLMMLDVEREIAAEMAAEYVAERMLRDGRNDVTLLPTT